MRFTFNHVCGVMAAVSCLNSGQSFARIAKSAGVTPGTVRRWVNSAGFRKCRWDGLYRVR